MNDKQEIATIVDPSKYELIKSLYAKGATNEEFELYLYTANRFGLDPLLKQIWCVKYKGEKAQIYVARDGYLEIAHRSGQFNGLESGMKSNTTAYAKVYRKDMQYPFAVEVEMNEYSTNMSVWKTKPKTMLIKVAESQALRKAFSISGVYSPEEMGQWEMEVQGIEIPRVESRPVIEQPKTEGFDWSKINLESKPKWEFTPDKKPIAPKIVKRLFAISGKLGIANNEFKDLCYKLTQKEHSYQWTYGDIKAIDDKLVAIERGETEQPAEEPEEDILELTEDDYMKIIGTEEE